MKVPPFTVALILRASALALVALFVHQNVAAQIITLDNSGSQTFALDPTRHFLYAGEGNGPGGTKHLDVINTLTNTVVGSYSFSGSGYSSQIAASGTNVFWADQGDSLVRVISVNSSGTPSLTRSDSLTLATGVAALSTTYAANLQGTGDVMKIVDIATGTVLHTTTVGSPAGIAFADTNSNLYYSSITGSYQVLNTSGTILRTLSGNVLTIDSAATHNFVYFVPNTNTHLLQQLTGSNDAATGFSYDFGSGATISNAAVNATTGNVWVSLTGQNKVYAFDSSLNLLQQFSLTSPEAIAYQDGYAYVHQSGTSTISLIAIPEPGTTALLCGLAAAAVVTVRRRQRASPRSTEV